MLCKSGEVMESRHGVSSNISLPDTQLNQLSTQLSTPPAASPAPVSNNPVIPPAQPPSAPTREPLYPLRSSTLVILAPVAASYSNVL